MVECQFEPINVVASFHFFFFDQTQMRMISTIEQPPSAVTTQGHTSSSSRNPSSYDHLHSLGI